MNLGVGSEDLLLVAGAQRNDEKRKGFAFIETALGHIEELLPNVSGLRSVIVVSFGHGQPAIRRQSPWLQHVHLGVLGESELASLFGAADLLLFPSREENFSNTILESLLCGCPVLGFEIGGVPEAVRHGENGSLVADLSGQAYATALEALLRPGVLEALRERTLIWQRRNRDSYGPASIAAVLEAIYRRPVAAPPRQSPVVSPVKEAAKRWHSLGSMAMVLDGRRDYVLRQVRASVSRAGVALSQKDTLIVPLYLGFSAPEHNDALGTIQWISQGASVHFVLHARSTPMRFALILQIPRHEFPVALWEGAKLGLSIRFNGQILRPRFVPPAGSHDHPYIVGEVEISLVDSADCRFELHFASLAVDPGKDNRELCLMIGGASVVMLQPTDNVESLDGAECALLLMRSHTPSLVMAEDTPDWAADSAWLDLLQQ